MAKKGDMLYAWTNDAEIKKKAETRRCSHRTLEVCARDQDGRCSPCITKGTDLYDAQPVLITDPKDLAQDCRFAPLRDTPAAQDSSRNTLTARTNMKIGVTVKGCDTMGMYELAKRKQINLDNIVMIGVNCGGSVSPVIARKMITEKFGVDPDKVHKEEIDKGQFIIEMTREATRVSPSTNSKRQGYGRRSNCRRCKMKIPRQADLACGNWGVIGDKAGKATFVEVCSEKGANLVTQAVKAGILATEPANPKGLEIRGKVEGAMLKLGDKWRKHDFDALGEGKDRLQEDHEGDLPLHQVLLVYRELPDLLLR